MSNFVYEPNTYTLQFGSGDQLHGLEVVVQSVPLGRFLRVMHLAGDAAGADASKAVGAVTELFSTLGEALVSWNLTDRQGAPVPCTADGLDGQPTELGMRLVQEWMQAIGGVSPELGKGSGSGVTYPEVPMPMAAA